MLLHAGAIETAKAGSPVDIMMGTGGTPEGALHTPENHQCALPLSRGSCTAKSMQSCGMSGTIGAPGMKIGPCIDRSEE